MASKPTAPARVISAHLSPNMGDPALFRSLNLDYVVGTDGIVMQVFNGDYSQLTALGIPYYHRVPNQCSQTGAEAVCACPAFNGTVEILNEPDLWGQSPDLCAKFVTNTINNFRLVEPVREFKFVLGAGSQLGYLKEWYSKFKIEIPFVAAVWAKLPQDIKAQIDCLGVHFYPANAAWTPEGTFSNDLLYDPNALRRFLRGTVRAAEITYGMVDTEGNPLDVLVTEFGYDTMTPKGSTNAAYVAENQMIASLIPQVLNSVSSLTWLRGIHWYLANYWQDYKSPWNTLVNQSGARLTAAGKAWAGV